MVNKDEIVFKVMDKTGYSKVLVEEVVNTLLDTIIEELDRDGEVKFANFGKFLVRSRVERNILNPSTKEVMRIPTLSSVLFKPSKNVKDLLNRDVEHN